MEDLKPINYVFFGQNIIPDIAKKLNLDLFTRLEIKCSLNNKHNFVLGLEYINLYSKYNIVQYSMLSEFDYDIAVFVCNFSDENSLNNLKNFKFEKSDDPEFVAKQFVDLKDYIKRRRVYPVVVGYHKEGEENELSEKDLESFAEELEGYFLYTDDPHIPIIEITEEFLSKKYNNKLVTCIYSPDEDIKFRFSIVNEKKKKKTYSCRPY